MLIIENFLEILSMKIIKGALFENKARRCIYNLINAVKHFHEQKLLHRNICLESIVIGPGMYWYDSIKLGSFESSVEGERVQAATTEQMDESWRFSAPEVLRNQPYTQESDVWSIGVVAATLLLG